MNGKKPPKVTGKPLLANCPFCKANVHYVDSTIVDHSPFVTVGGRLAKTNCCIAGRYDSAFDWNDKVLGAVIHLVERSAEHRERIASSRAKTDSNLVTQS